LAGAGSGGNEPARGRSGRHSAGLPDAWPYVGSDASHADDSAREPRRAAPQDPAWSYGDRDTSRTSAEHVLPAPPGRSPSGRSPSGSWPYPDDELTSGDHDARQPARSPSGQAPSGPRPYGDADRAAGGYGGATGYGTRDDRDYDGDDGPDDGEPRRSRRPSARAASERLGVPDRLGRRGRDDRGGRSGRQDGEPASSWSGGDDALEPLPPLDGQSRSQGRRGAWQPAGDDQDDWDQPGGRNVASQRWSAPAADYEPEYEGDSW
jgi:hypothetical protein